MRVAIAADHNGVDLKARLVAWLTARSHEVDDRGTHDASLPVDYPPLCVDACRQVLEGHADRAIIIGGTGGGEMIVCNRLAGIRAGLGYRVDTTVISRANNDSNVLVLGTKVVDETLSEEIVDVWLATDFTGGRHRQRLDQIAALERGDPFS